MGDLVLSDAASNGTVSNASHAKQITLSITKDGASSSENFPLFVNETPVTAASLASLVADHFVSDDDITATAANNDGTVAITVIGAP